MGETAQDRAIRQYRARLLARGMARFEVIGLDDDRALIRALAKRLSENDARAADIRAAVHKSIAPAQEACGGVWAALRQAPPEVADLDLTRSRDDPRRIDF